MKLLKCLISVVTLPCIVAPPPPLYPALKSTLQLGTGDIKIQVPKQTCAVISINMDPNKAVQWTYSADFTESTLVSTNTRRDSGCWLATDGVDTVGFARTCGYCSYVYGSQPLSEKCYQTAEEFSIEIFNPGPADGEITYSAASLIDAPGGSASCFNVFSPTPAECAATDVTGGACVVNNDGTGGKLVGDPTAMTCECLCFGGWKGADCGVKDFPPTPAPLTQAPDTPAPKTPAPKTPSPKTPAPDTNTPAVPPTLAPATGAPATGAPTTGVPSTSAPATSAPQQPPGVTSAPATGAPAAVTLSPKDTVAPPTPLPPGATFAPPTPNPPPPVPQEEDEASMWWIGAVLGGLALLIAIVVLVYVCCCKGAAAAKDKELEFSEQKGVWEPMMPKEDTPPMLAPIPTPREPSELSPHEFQYDSDSTFSAGRRSIGSEREAFEADDYLPY